MVCMSDPGDGKKGDTKLVRKRQIVLERMGCVVDILYFRWNVCKSSIEVKCNDHRKGVDIVASISAWKMVVGLMASWRRLSREPIQTWLSFTIAGAWNEAMETIFSSYTSIHFFHIRSVGLWKLASENTRVIADLIDSYTLNLGNWLRVERRWWARLLLREEYKRICRMELGIEDYFRNRLKSTLVTVASTDLGHIGGNTVRKVVVPVGIQIEVLGKSAIRGKKLGCIFFGNLDYRPNIDACHVIIDVAKELRAKGIDEIIEITVAGRNISRGLKRMLKAQGVEVISPVESMFELVRSKNVAVLPMMSGSGMQSKILEAISWGVVVIATPRTARPLGLIRNEEYVEVGSSKDIVERLEDIVNGRYELDSVRKRAHKRIEEFGWEETCVKLQEEYRR